MISLTIKKNTSKIFLKSNNFYLSYKKQLVLYNMNGFDKVLQISAFITLIFDILYI